MRSDNKDRLKRLFWEAETSEEQELWLRDNTDKEEDPVLHGYFTAMGSLGAEDHTDKNTQAKVRRLGSRIYWWGLAAAAAACLTGFILITNVFIDSTPGTVVQQEQQLTKEEYQIAVAAMDKFYRTWEKGENLAGKPFQKLADIRKDQ